MTEIHQTHKAVRKPAPVGVGLRHEHYSTALLKSSPSVDFVEIHAENFFAKGGAISRLLDQIVDTYPVSIHGTAMGLGSAQGISANYLRKFVQLVNRVNPILVSDHACFTWGALGNNPVHAGDLLPLKYDQATLNVLVNNIDQVQQALGRQILIENIVTYKHFENEDFYEAAFLAKVAEKTQCGLLVDLNNILVNYHNFSDANPLQAAKKWLQHIPPHLVQELHLAGSTPVQSDAYIVDDHGQPVSDECWELYETTLSMFPNAAVLIERDNNLPSWTELTNEAKHAREVANKKHMKAKSLEAAYA
ncbi:DUF692 domain-containing protein [Glaciecola sp. 1036]|uniref:DUF692 domain-containing protein n=1 Tax=Alteromonadaceae TaxID=72275 RepID=UPI003CFE8502